MAHTFDTSVANPATLTATATTNPLATDYTCGAGATVLVLMLAMGPTSAARTGGDPTFNSVPMTQADTNHGVTETSVEIWYMINPPTETQYSLSVPNSGGKAMKVVIASAKAATGYTSQYQDVGFIATTGASPNCTVNTTAGGVVFAVAASGDQSFAPTARTGTNLYQGDVGAWGYATQYLLETVTSTPRTMSFTEATSDDYGMIAVSFSEVSSATTHEGESAISISSILTVEGSVTLAPAIREGACALTVTSTQTIEGSVAHVTNEGESAINVTSELLAVGTLTHATLEGVSAINGTSDLTLAGSVLHQTIEAESALTGTSDLTLVGSILHVTHEGETSITVTSESIVAGTIEQAIFEAETAPYITSELLATGNVLTTHNANVALNITSDLSNNGAVLHQAVDGQTETNVSSTFNIDGMVSQPTWEGESSITIISNMIPIGSVLHTIEIGESSIAGTSSMSIIGSILHTTLEAEFLALVTSSLMVDANSGVLPIDAEVLMTLNSFVGTRRWYYEVEIPV